MDKSKIRSIKDALVTLLSGIHVDGEPAFVEVKGHPRGEFDGYPGVRVLPRKPIDNEKGAMAEQDRTNSFIVRVHMPSTDEGGEFDKMYDLTELIIDTLDQADQDDALNEIDSSIGTYLLNTTGGDWFEQNTQAGLVIMADINVEVGYSKEL
jgi:hypothetical protein